MHASEQPTVLKAHLASTLVPACCLVCSMWLLHTSFVAATHYLQARIPEQRHISPRQNCVAFVDVCESGLGMQQWQDYSPLSERFYPGVCSAAVPPQNHHRRIPPTAQATLHACHWYQARLCISHIKPMRS